MSPDLTRCAGEFAALARDQEFRRRSGELRQQSDTGRASASRARVTLISFKCIPSRQRIYRIDD
jgi:hypothetical protein